MSNRIKILAIVGHDGGFKRQTEMGVCYGEDIVRKVELTNEEAKRFIQAQVDRLSYQDAQKFEKKYRK